MMSIETIHELRSRTSVTSLEAMHALSASNGNVDKAADFLHTSGFAAKSLAVAGSEIAARLAASLVATGVWFECEQLDREQWRFAVAAAGYARLVALHGELLGLHRVRGAVG
ncbi:MAG: hypothetical protein ABI304_11855 [Rudaea sp.]